MKKFILIVLVIVVGLLIIIPIVLRLAGVKSGTSLTGGSVGQGLLKSEDGGETWTGVAVSDNKKISFPSGIYNLAYHPQNSDVIFLGSRGSGLWKSANGGKSWQNVTDKNGVLKPTSDVYKVSISHASPQIMYLAVYQDSLGRVLKSVDGGDSFKEVYTVTASGYGVFDLYVATDNPDNLIIITGQGGFLQTQDGGKTWRAHKWFGESLKTLLVNPIAPSEEYVITDTGNIAKTFDAGGVWTNLTDQINTENTPNYQPSLDSNTLFNLKQSASPFNNTFKNSAQTLTMDQNSPNILYLTLPNQLLRSKDGGFTWYNVDILTPPDSSPLGAVGVNPANSNIIFSGAGSQIYKSVDNGVNWKVINLPTSKIVKTFYFSPRNTNTMFAVMQ